MLQATDQNFKKLKIRINNEYTPEIGEGLELSTIPKSAKASVDTLIRMGALKIVEVNTVKDPDPIPTQLPTENATSQDKSTGSNKKSNQGGGSCK